MEPPVVSSEAVHEISSALFGRALRLPLALWVRTRSEPFFQRQAADGVGTHQTYIRKELATLVRLGMVRELPRTDGDNRLFYEQVPTHPWWGIIDAAHHAAKQSPTSDHH